jgi:hypothetical protein
VELYLHSPNTSLWRGAYLSTGTTLPFTFYVRMLTYMEAYGRIRKAECILNVLDAGE